MLTDDGIGIRMVDQLSSDLPGSDLAYSQAPVGGMDLIEEIREYKKVIFIDAARSVGAVAGEVRLMSPANFVETLHLSNFHDTDFLTTLKLAKEMQIQIAANLHIISIEIVEDQEFSDAFSEQIKGKYEEIYQHVKGIVLSLI